MAIDWQIVLITLTMISALGTAVVSLFVHRSDGVEKRAALDSLSNLRKQLDERTQELLHYGTGGNSFAKLRFSNVGPTRMDIEVTNAGKYPIYDLTATIIDVDEFRLKKQEGSLDKEPWSFLKDYEVGNLSVNGVSGLQQIYFNPRALRRNINATFFARNGYFRQQIVMKWKNDEWLVSYVITDLNEDTVDSYTEPGFYESGEEEIVFAKGRITGERVSMTVNDYKNLKSKDQSSLTKARPFTYGPDNP